MVHQLTSQFATHYGKEGVDVSAYRVDTTNQSSPFHWRNKQGQRGQSREGVVPGRSRREGRKIAHQNVLTKEHKSQYDSLISKPKVTTSRTNFCYF